MNSNLSAAGAMNGLADLLADLSIDNDKSSEAGDDVIEQTDAESIVGAGEAATIDQPTEEVAKPPVKTVKGKKAAAPVTAKSKGAARKEKRKAKAVTPVTAEVTEVKTDEAGNPVAVEATEVAPVAPTAPVEKRVFFGRNKMGRLEHKLGANIGNVFILSTDDAELEGDALNAKVLENKAAFQKLAQKVQNRATNVIEFIGGKASRLNVVTESIVRLLAKDRKLTTGDKGNIFGKLGASYSPGAARATGNSTLGMLRALNIVSESGKGVFEPCEKSTFLALISERLGLSFADNAGAIAEIEAAEADAAAALAASVIDSAQALAAVEPAAELGTVVTAADVMSSEDRSVPVEQLEALGVE